MEPLDDYSHSLIPSRIDVLHQLLACVTLLVRKRCAGPHILNVRDLALNTLEMVDQQNLFAGDRDALRTKTLVLELVGALRTNAHDEMMADWSEWERIKRIASDSLAPPY